MKKLFIILTLIFITINFTGCKKDLDKASGTSQKSVSSYYPITITDLNNKKGSIDKKPERIVVLSPAAAEMIYNLGYGKNIVGISEQCSYMKELSNIKRVSSYADINVELIQSLNPDIIFTSKFVYESINNKFLENKIPVVYIDSESYTGIYDAIDILGIIFDEKVKAGNIKKSLQTKIEQLTQSIPEVRKNILYVQSIDPIYVAGGKTLINDIIYLAGGANAALNVDGYGKLDVSKINEKNIDIILLSSQLPIDINLEYLMKHQLFKDLEAVKDKHVYRAKDENNFVTPSPRVINGIEETLKIIQQER